MIVTLVVIAIIAAIVMVNVQDFKERAVKTAIESNASILQTSVDMYYLKEENYPTKGNAKITISTPQEIDIDFLVDNGYVKKELNRDIIKSQYYWVDAFGRVWGSSTDAVKEFAYHTDKNDKKKLDFKLKDRAEGFVFYELKNKQAKSSSEDINKNNLVADISEGFNGKYIFTKLGKWFAATGSKVNLETPNPTSEYLISTIDKYGLETAPFGNVRNPYFTPIYKGEGHYYFEISGVDKMHWVDFWAITDTPADSKVEFKFAIQSEINGEFSEQVNDFYSLEDAYGIRVHMYLTRGSNGERPSVIDVNVLFNLGGEEVKEVVERPNDIPPCTDDCIGYNDNPEGLTPQQLDSMCGPSTNLNKPNTLAYSFYLDKGDKIASISTSNLETYGMNELNTFYEFSNNKGSFERVETVYEIPSDSCVNIIQEYEKVEEQLKKPQPPIVMVGKDDKPLLQLDKETISKGNIEKPQENNPDKDKPNEDKPNEDKPKPNEETPKLSNPPFTGTKPSELSTLPKENLTDPEVNSENWLTIDKIRFFGLSGSNSTQWTGWEKKDFIPEKTRIVYRFSYHVNGSWTNELTQFEVRNAKNLVITAYLQVELNERDNENRAEPAVEYVKMFNSAGGSSHQEVMPPYEKEEVSINVKKITPISWEGVSNVSKTIFYKEKGLIANIGYMGGTTPTGANTFIQAGYLLNGEFVYSKEKYGFQKLSIGNISDMPHGGVFDKDGNIYIVGASTSKEGLSSSEMPKASEYSFISKVNAFGELEWRKPVSINNTVNNYLKDIVELPNGNLLAIGSYNNSNYILIEIDKKGKVISETLYAENNPKPLELEIDKNGTPFALLTNGIVAYMHKINLTSKTTTRIEIGNLVNIKEASIEINKNNEIVFGGTLKCQNCLIEGNLVSNYLGASVIVFSTEGSILREKHLYGQGATYLYTFELDKDDNIVFIGTSNVRTGSIVLGSNNTYVGKIDNKTWAFKYTPVIIDTTFKSSYIFPYDTNNLIIFGRREISSTNVIVVMTIIKGLYK